VGSRRNEEDGGRAWERAIEEEGSKEKQGSDLRLHTEGNEPELKISSRRKNFED